MYLSLTCAKLPTFNPPNTNMHANPSRCNRFEKSHAREQQRSAKKAKELDDNAALLRAYVESSKNGSNVVAPWVLSGDSSRPWTSCAGKDCSLSPSLQRRLGTTVQIMTQK